MRPGLPQGFVIFGTLAHRVLVILHQLGDMCQNELMEELGTCEHHMSLTLRRLSVHRFIYKAGKIHTYDTGLKTQMRWSLKHHRPRDIPEYRPATSAERMRRLRAAEKARQATSVFNLDRHSCALLKSMKPNAATTALPASSVVASDTGSHTEKVVAPVTSPPAPSTTKRSARASTKAKPWPYYRPTNSKGCSRYE